MHTIVKNRVLPVLAGAAVVVAGLNAASYAANGHPLTLGGKNAESRTATVTNTGKGAALSLKSGKKSPSLAVSSSALVTHLNADQVDGKNGADLQTQATTWTIPAGTQLSYTLKGLTPGTYLATLNVVLGGATGPGQCQLNENGAPAVLAFGADRPGGFSVVSGSGVVTHSTGDTLQVVCDSTNATDVLGDAPSTVTLVRLDHVTTGTLTPDPPD